MKYDPMRARLAVQFLVDSPYFHHHIVKLRSALRRPRSLPFKDSAEVLNELLVIGRQSPDALENLIEVAESKRSNRNEYQRDYMAKKRQRERHAIELEEVRQGRSLSLDERIQVLHSYQQAWNARKGALLSSYGDIAWLERNRITREFWDRIDAELVDRIEELSARRPRRGAQRQERSAVQAH